MDLCRGTVSFSIWSEGLGILSEFLGVQVPTNLIFSALIFVILIYLLHLSRVNSKLQHQVTRLTQELAILNQRLETLEAEKQN
ncbi:DUF2304 domain-containing protein [Niabella hibiscisoli]|nr:DUF2304 domain-containing protein [Niabella hibiscisoli]MCH5718093.1 DUF2304 domain-containing protein [Niabella hibiscisoli]